MDHLWKYQEVIFGRMNFKSEFNLVIRLMILGSEMGPWRKTPMILHDQLNFPQNLIVCGGLRKYFSQWHTQELHFC